jgi:hypothetical protein
MTGKGVLGWDDGGCGLGWAENTFAILVFSSSMWIDEVLVEFN